MATCGRSLRRVMVMMFLLQRNSRSWPLLSRHVRLSRLLSWPGTVHSSSDHTIYVGGGDDLSTVEQAIAANLKLPWTESVRVPLESIQLSPRNLLELGAIWHMSESAGRNPQSGDKPLRLSLDNATMKLSKVENLRIHHNPRRFPNVYNFNWTSWKTDPGGVVVDRRTAFLIIDKPPNIPVHPTVDNVIENVAGQIRKTLAVGAYVSTPQRLDQNTSGLLVVARSKGFANYYASLLRTKTEDLVNADNQKKRGIALQKGYKCLLCIIADEGTSMTERFEQLKSFDILQHYLEPSLRAPKNFARIQRDESWAESLLRVTHVGEPLPLSGSHAAQQLRSRLWDSCEAVPINCVGVVEIQVELLTGRTHQIRGQFKAEGFPLVGDAQYGGCIPSLTRINKRFSDGFEDSERLALRCSYLKFLDPDVITKQDGVEDMYPSNRWNEYHLDDSWWAPFLEQYNLESPDGCGTITTHEPKSCH